MQSTALLEVRNLSKSFPGVRALTDVSLTLGRGEVLAVIGENGAGKSTLMKILAGVQTQDSGQLLLDGREVRIDSTRAALKLGISLIHQELNLADNLDVGANIFLGREPRKGIGALSVIDRRRIDREAVNFTRPVGLDLSPRTIVGTLPIGRQQMVEIAKALSTDARVLIMDEPTSSLTQHETEHLFRVVKDLRSRGISVVYISHRLGEVKELADRVVVLRDGRNAGELKRDEITHDRMVKLMVGRDLSQFYQRQSHPAGEPALEVEGLKTPAHPRHPVSFTVRAGEIVGLAGLVGAGRTELLTTLFGVTPAVGGSIRVAGRYVTPQSPIDAIRAGVALVPEDRKQQGLVLEMAVRQNMSLPSLGRTRRAIGFLNRRAERSISAEMTQALNVKTPTDLQVVQFLSGGNQQKVVIGKWLAMKPRVLLLDEPTRGVDVGAKQEIYRLMEKLAATGVAILFVSSEMEEVIGMSDRTLVMHEGRLTGELSRAELSEEGIMHLATGRASAQADEGVLVQ
jgi:ribose transport system ATP-binding protein